MQFIGWLRLLMCGSCSSSRSPLMATFCWFVNYCMSGHDMFVLDAAVSVCKITWMMKITATITTLLLLLLLVVALPSALRNLAGMLAGYVDTFQPRLHALVGERSTDNILMTLKSQCMTLAAVDGLDILADCPLLLCSSVHQTQGCHINHVQSAS